MTDNPANPENFDAAPGLTPDPDPDPRRALTPRPPRFLSRTSPSATTRDPPRATGTGHNTTTRHGVLSDIDQQFSPPIHRYSHTF